MRRTLYRLVLGMVFAGAAPAQNVTPVIEGNNPPNTKGQQKKHYVVLVSLDGFRYDYPAKYGAPYLQAIAQMGTTAPEGMLPSYPSLTFPNHWTLVTGLYPEHHGIVGNNFYDPSRTTEQGQTYAYTQSKASGDGSWYGGTPLWVLAEQQGMRAACLFWPGSEAEIQGKRPSYYLKFDNNLDDRKRVEQVLAWLRLPPKQRPHFITLYYSNVDHAGHLYGPDSDEVRAAVHHVDDMIGGLRGGIYTLDLPVDLIVVADHGMVALKGEPIDLSIFADLSDAHTDGSLIYAKDDAGAAKIYDEFKAHPDPRFSVYRRKDVPAAMHFDSNEREGDPVVVPNGPYTFRTKPATGTSDKLLGGHGFDPATMPEMKAIFFAEGPDVPVHGRFRPFENVDIYPWISQMLGLDLPPGQKIDGSLAALNAAKIESDFTLPKLLYKEEARFTEEAKANRIDGAVVIALTIEEDGTPSNIRVVRGLGYGLNESAVEAVSHFRFAAAEENGKPVAVEVHVEVNFKIF